MNKKKIYPQWFLILPLALYIIFFLLPSIMGVAYSFTDWNSRSVLNGVHFVGLDNFKEIFTSNKDYLSGIGNTLKFTKSIRLNKITDEIKSKDACIGTFLALLELVRLKEIYLEEEKINEFLIVKRDKNE